MAACKSWMKYSWETAYCENPPMEGNPDGLCILHSLRPDKDKSAFDQAVQSKLAQQDYNFRDTAFPSPISFAKLNFMKPVDFRGARFSGWADFREAELGQETDFSHAKFAQEGDLKQGGDFHYGEMEMHRRASPWRRWFPLSWYNLHWALSGYGERPLRAVGWLLWLLLVMAGWLNSLGLKTIEGTRVGFGYALIFILQQVTFLSTAWLQPLSPGGHLLGALSRILLLAQAALFLLALCNRLGRRR
jgi:hypothetical protein